MTHIFHSTQSAWGKISDTQFHHSYSGAEMSEIGSAFETLFEVQTVVSRVNRQYIESAAQADQFRTEPPFKLQGSYRNMNKMSEKINAVMNEEELRSVIRDHYIGEAQTLTSGAEENLLKLGEILGGLSDDERVRWQQIKSEYGSTQGMEGVDVDPLTKVANQISKIGLSISAMQQSMHQSALESQPLAQIAQELKSIGCLLENAQMNVDVVNQPVPGMDAVLQSMGEAINTTLLPVVSAMEHKLRMDHDIWERVKSLGEQLSNLQGEIVRKTKSTKKFGE